MLSESSGKSALRMFLFGPLSVIGPEGTDHTPRNQKSKATLALLALAPRGSRTRIWLRDKLWSNRTETQASASLRQALLDIRKALGPAYKDLLQTNKYSVTLDLSQVEVDVIQQLEHAQVPGGELKLDVTSISEHFLEGFDICDPEFESWLTMERRIWEQRFQEIMDNGPEQRAKQAQELLSFVNPSFPKIPSEQSAPALSRINNRATRWAIGVDCVSWDGHSVPRAANIFSGKFSRQISDIAQVGSIRLDHLSIRDLKVEIPIVLKISECTQHGNLRLHIELNDGDTTANYWTAGQSFSPAELRKPHAPAFNGLISRCVAELGRHLQTPGMGEDVLLAGRLIESVNRIFNLGPNDLQHAELTLADILKQRPHPQAYAWMAFAKSFRVGQRFSPDTAALVSEAQYYSTRALEESAHDPLILSLAAHIHSYLFSEYDIAASLFERALKSDPEQIIGWDLYAMLHAYTGLPEKAMAMAAWAQYLGSNSPISYYYDTTRCIASTLAGDYQDAVLAGERALVARPGFNSVLRYLISANAHLGNFQAVDELRRRLNDVEPDFSTGVLIESGYPGLSTRGGKRFLRGLSIAGLDHSS